MSKSTTLQETVSCKQTISGSATLQRNLYCPGLASNEAAITMDGSTAMLDCAGKAVIGDCTATGCPSGVPTGILLCNGATAVNCISTRFYKGFRLEGDGDNQVIDSIASNNNNDGIEIEASSGTQLILRTSMVGNDFGISDSGTSTKNVEVKESLIAGNRIDGIEHESNTSMLVLDSAIFGNNVAVGGSGIDVDGGGTVIVENTNVFNNQDDGIFVDDGTVTLKNVEISFNGDDNIVAATSGKVETEEGVYACGATGEDVDEINPGEVDTTVAQPVCVNGTTFTECMEGCDQPGNASALVCV